MSPGRKNGFEKDLPRIQQMSASVLNLFLEINKILVHPTKKRVAHVGPLVADSLPSMARRNGDVARLTLLPHSNILTY